jgi:hypothetical protein
VPAVEVNKGLESVPEPSSQLAEPKPASIAEGSPAQASGDACADCGVNVPAGCVFCSACGVKQPVPDDIFWCCACEREVDDDWTCGVSGCGHHMCEECLSDMQDKGMDGAVCLCHLPEPSEGSHRSQDDRHMLKACLTRLTDCMVGQKDLLEKKMSGGRPSTLKVNASTAFPKGSDKALEDLDSWFNELIRVSKHLNGGAIPQPPLERITSLLDCWEMSHKVGRALRTQQNDPEYLEKERLLEGEWCWKKLLAIVHSHDERSVKKAQGRG